MKIKEAISNWLREKSVFNPEDPFFNTSKMFRSKKDLADKHDEIYRLYKFCHYEKDEY